jgi:hypothetical protein
MPSLPHKASCLRKTPTWLRSDEQPSNGGVRWMPQRVPNSDSRSCYRWAVRGVEEEGAGAALCRREWRVWVNSASPSERPARLSIQPMCYIGLGARKRASRHSNGVGHRVSSPKSLRQCQIGRRRSATITTRISFAFRTTCKIKSVLSRWRHHLDRVRASTICVTLFPCAKSTIA